MPSPHATAIATYRQALPPEGRYFSFPLTSLDRLSIPVWSNTLALPNGLLRSGIGYGATEEEAQTGALGELTEDLANTRALARLPRTFGSYRALAPRGAVDPLTLCLEAGSPYTPDLELEWVEARRWPSGEPVLVPVEWVACTPLPPGPVPRLITPITNGQGAGSTQAMAVAHGLLELLQRDGNSVHYRALAHGTALDPATITDEPSRALLAHFATAGLEVAVKIADTSFGLTNLYVVGADTDPTAGGLPITTAACGEAAHPVAAVALRKALLEFASSRARLAFFHGPLERVRALGPDYLETCLASMDPAAEEPVGLQGLQQWLRLSLAAMRALLARPLHVSELIPWENLPTIPESTLGSDKATLLHLVAERLQAVGLEILVIDFSEPATGVHAVKVIIPGLEVETMSYHRLGERNLRRLLTRTEQPALVGLGTPPSGALRVPLTTAAETRLGSPAWFSPAAARAALGPLYPLYREPNRHVAPYTMACG